jgi:hypothetical protein
MSRQHSANFGWLKRTGQSWKLASEVWIAFLGMASVWLGLILLIVSFFVGAKPLIIAGGLWFVYGVLKFGQIIVKYYFLKCPWCGFNPTREQGTGRWLHEDVVHNRLADLDACPGCGRAEVRDDKADKERDFKDYFAGFFSVLLAGFAGYLSWYLIAGAAAFPQLARLAAFGSALCLIAAFGFGLAGRHTRMGKLGVLVSCLVIPLWLCGCWAFAFGK